LMTTPLLGSKTPSVPASFWQGTTIALPDDLADGDARNLLQAGAPASRIKDLAELLSPLSLAAIALS